MMGLKSIEMQVAIPRTQEATRIQDQLNQRGNLLHAQNLEEQKDSAEKLRRKSTKLEEKNSVKLQDEEKKREKDSNQQQKKEKEQAVVDSKHPYKGKRIDLRL